MRTAADCEYFHSAPPLLTQCLHEHVSQPGFPISTGDNVSKLRPGQPSGLFLLFSYFLRFFFYSGSIRFFPNGEGTQAVEKHTNTPANYRKDKPREPSTSRKPPYEYNRDVYDNVYDQMYKEALLCRNLFPCLFIDFLFRHTGWHFNTSISLKLLVKSVIAHQELVNPL